MRIALFSDIHANLPAFEAVLKDIENKRPDAVYCLGDLVGYAPWPNEYAGAAFQQSLEIMTRELAYIVMIVVVHIKPILIKHWAKYPFHIQTMLLPVQNVNICGHCPCISGWSSICREKIFLMFCWCMEARAR